ncbi:MAG: hypothetical protein ABIS38_03615 [Sphingomicrobium sp.]
MKKLLLSLGACSLAFVAPVAVPTAAIAQADNSSIVKLCKSIIAAYPGAFKNLGECVSFPAKICNEVKKADGFPIDAGDGTILRNHGECVNYVKVFNNA